MSAPKNNHPTSSTAPPRWLSIIGIGEDGVDALNANAQSLIKRAKLVVGGARHLALADDLISGARLQWPTPITDAIGKINEHRAEPVVVLASGDPFHYGVGNLIAQNFPSSEILCIPQPSAFSLAASRMGWALQETTLVTLHGRPLAGLNRHLHKGAQILALSWDSKTPQQVAIALSERGLGQATLTVLESLAGPDEKVRTTRASKFDLNEIAHLNTIAIDLSDITESAQKHAPFARLTSGLQDSAFEHDGQLTKQDIRALTISALDPRHEERLWDIGLGAGSIAIEWLLVHPSLKAIGFEKDQVRADRALRNALTLGTPELEVITGPAPEVLQGQPQPDVVFIGGGITTPGLFEAAWSALPQHGRLIANAVTLESEAKLVELHAKYGGELIKIGLARASTIGRMRGWRAAMPVVQWRVTKVGGHPK